MTGNFNSGNPFQFDGPTELFYLRDRSDLTFSPHFNFFYLHDTSKKPLLSYSPASMNVRRG